MMFTYNFPEFMYKKSMSYLDQAKHAISEAIEVKKAIFEEESPERIIEECMDAIHSQETQIRKIAKREGLSDADLAKIHAFVIKKNRERFYYEDTH